MSDRLRRPALRVLAVLLLALASPPDDAGADEASFEDRPAGESVEDLDSGLSRAVEERARLHTLFPRLKRYMQRYPNFIADTELVLNFRTYAFPLRTIDGVDANAWAAGGKFAFRSGWWRDSVQLGAGLYTSLPIVADDPQALTELLRPEEQGFAVFGEAFGRFRWRSTELTLGRSELRLPYVNRNDSRMAPNSFQGLVADGTARGVPWVNRVDWVAGWLGDVRLRNDDGFVSMSEGAGAEGSDEGMLMGGLQFRPAEHLSFGAYNYLVRDTFNTFYAAADSLWKLSADAGLRFQAQYTGQRSVGQELIGELETWSAAARAAASYRGVTAWLALSTTADDAGIQSPYGSYPGYVSMMQSDFNRGGERAWSTGLTWAPRWSNGWSFFVLYGQGNGGFDPLSGEDQADEREIDLTIDYEIDEGPWRGLWLRLRGSMLDQRHAASRGYEARIILNYVLPVL